VGTRQYVIRKIVQAFLTLVAILVFNFFLFRVWSPGDPITFLTRGQGANISPEERQALIA
jgi:ABC-type dipeptide/oligopeptide/nickel transport system permease component